MRAGFSTGVITPPAGIRMSGYRLRAAPAAGRQDDLEARCALLDDGQSAFALISLDLIGLDYGHATAIKGRIAERCGLQPEQILLGCTHTHSGPDTLHLHTSTGPKGIHWNPTLKLSYDHLIWTVAKWETGLRTLRKCLGSSQVRKVRKPVSF